MTTHAVQTVPAQLLASFEQALPDQLRDAFSALSGAVWRDGSPAPEAGRVAALLVDRIERLNVQQQGYLAILLGLLAECDQPAADNTLHAVIGKGLPRYLRLLASCRRGEPLTAALLYLLGHFPADRGEILGVAGTLDLQADELSRLDRTLAFMNPADPGLGRVWPAPSVWSLNEQERQFDQASVATLTPQQLEASWRQDTGTLLGYSGARAYWAVCNDARSSLTEGTLQPEVLAAPAGGNGWQLFREHAATMRCPGCGAELRFDETGASCAAGSHWYSLDDGILDLTSSAVRPQADVESVSLLQQLSAMSSMGLYYEAVARPAFLRVSGSNWDGQVEPSDELRYLGEHVRPVPGPVLDLGAGAGAWTRMLVEVVGAERVVALDPGVPMLRTLRARLDQVPAVLGTGTSLPFADASLGAVNCWNALQAFPAGAQAAIAEVGRCLSEGGSFTIMTFGKASDPVYSYFQRLHRFPNHESGLQLFDVDALRGWLADAGLRIIDEWLPGTFVFMTAIRSAGPSETGPNGAEQPADHDAHH